VTREALKLTTYFGERDRADGVFLADALLDLCERQGVQVSVLVRGTEGFGLKHRLQSQRLLTLSEDLPVVTVAVDAAERIRALLPEVVARTGDGLVTLERARMLTGGLEAGALDGSHDATKLTLYVGRHERAGGRPAHLAVVDLLHRRGIAGATVLLGVDGTVGGERRRARFLAGNADVPVMIISVGDGDRIAAVLPEIAALLPRPIATLEDVQVCKRDGRLLSAPRRWPERDASGLGVWQKLMVYASEQARHEGRPLYLELVRRLRAAGAAGATALRGVWGYHGDHVPHGDRFWALARRVPVVTVIVDTPERTQAWFEIVDELTAETGLVTSEMVPALRATGPDLEHGGLELSGPA
jgi:PII-like signaling protein